jgi:hypothetical protein
MGWIVGVDLQLPPDSAGAAGGAIFHVQNPRLPRGQLRFLESATTPQHFFTSVILSSLSPAQNSNRHISSRADLAKSHRGRKGNLGLELAL